MKENTMKRNEKLKETWQKGGKEMQVLRPVPRLWWVNILQYVWLSTGNAT